MYLPVIYCSTEVMQIAYKFNNYSTYAMNNANQKFVHGHT